MDRGSSYLRQLNEESPPAWVIRETQLPKNGTTRQTGTPLPDLDVNSGEVLEQVGGRRDGGKGKERDSGYGESTERHGQLITSVPKQAERTTVSKSIAEQTRDSTHD